MIVLIKVFLVISILNLISNATLSYFWSVLATRTASTLPAQWLDTEEALMTPVSAA